ncbi:MAG: ATP-binding protein, partial [Clostridia bacterium]
MKEISLHILDIIQNSIAAEADKITVSIEEMTDRDSLSIEIADNGKGMDSETLAGASDPFMTTRKTRKVGLGLSMFKAGVEAC